MFPDPLFDSVDAGREFGRDEQGSKACEAYKAGCCTFRLVYEFLFSVMHGGFDLFFALAVKRSELRGLKKSSLRNFRFAWISYYDVAAGIIGRVHPCVARVRDLERQHIVVDCFFADEDLEIIRRNERSDA